jgi:uncharacterized protein (TIGR04255 family)
VVLGAQFKPIEGFGVPHLGLLWERFRDRFPRFEQHPPLGHTIERRGVRPQQPQFEMQVISGALKPRLWVLNEAGDQLLQVQEDRFIRNWRRYQDRGSDYPRYHEYLRRAFDEDLAQFMDFVRSEGFRQIEFDQAEVTYINHIETHDIWSSHSDAAKVLRDFNADYSELTGLKTETVRLRTRHELTDDSGEFVGRLHVDFDAGVLSGKAGDEPKNRPIFVLQLVARGRPLAPGVDGLFKFLDLGHDAIVYSFDKITTNAMHKAWGKLA